MLAKHSTKIIISFLSLSVLTIGFLVWWLSFDLPQTKRVSAGIPRTISDGWIPLRGYAWVGAPNACGGATGIDCGATTSPSWISFNYKDTGSGGYCVNSSGTPQSPNQTCVSNNDCATNYSCLAYWVAVNDDTGKLDGYAWSDNVGWIDFNPSWSDIISAGLDTNFYSNCGNGCNSSGDDCSACYNKTTRKFYGWARVLSEADASSAYDTGWIRLGDLVVSGTDFGLKVINETDSQVSADPKGGAPWGDLLGWSWNGANANIGTNSTSGLGWISTNCSNPNAGGCASAYQYQVSGRPDSLGTLQITRVDGDDGHALNVNWVNGYPAYGATWYDVWRQNGKCVYNGTTVDEHCNPALCHSAICTGGECHKGALTWGSCSDSTDCYGSCNNSLSYEVRSTSTSSNIYQDTPLELYVNYKYIVRSCNIFGCAKTSLGDLLTSPISTIGNFKAVPICAATSQTSRIDFSWGKPYIISNSNASLVKYELEYCQSDVKGDLGKCTWTSAVANCASTNLNTGLNSNPFICSENILSSDSRYGNGSKNFYIYRVRGVADKGTCSGGSNDGKECPANSCPGGTCDYFKSSWSFSNEAQPFRICPVGSSYQEQRPTN